MTEPANTPLPARIQVCLHCGCVGHKVSDPPDGPIVAVVVTRFCPAHSEGRGRMSIHVRYLSRDELEPFIRTRAL